MVTLERMGTLFTHGELSDWLRSRLQQALAGMRQRAAGESAEQLAIQLIPRFAVEMVVFDASAVKWENRPTTTTEANYGRSVQVPKLSAVARIPFMGTPQLLTHCGRTRYSAYPHADLEPGTLVLSFLADSVDDVPELQSRCGAALAEIQRYLDGSDALVSEFNASLRREVTAAAATAVRAQSAAAALGAALQGNPAKKG